MTVPLRILQLTTNFKQGGIQRHILDLTGYLRAAGHTVILAGAPNVWGNPQIDPDFVSLPVDRVSAVNSSRLGRMTSIFRCALQLRRVLAERQIGLVHCHETAPALVGCAATIGRRVPMVLTYHGSAPRRTRQFAKIARYCADHVISPSRATLDALVKEGVPEERTRVLGLGIAPKPAPDPQRIASIRVELGLSPSDRFVFSLSRLDVQKGIDVMIEVAKSVLSRTPNTVFAVAGTGPLADEVSAWAEAAGISNRFRFLGSVSDIENYLALADLFLLTSRWEALPISIPEAFRAGLPVVATDCGGVRELVDDGVGRLCRVEDVAGLTDAVATLLQDDALRAALGAEALARSKSARFDPDTVHAGFEAFYREILL